MTDWRDIDSAPITLGGGRKPYRMLVCPEIGKQTKIAIREHDDTWTDDSGGPMQPPIAWMPLPQPYEGKK